MIQIIFALRETILEWNRKPRMHSADYRVQKEEFVSLRHLVSPARCSVVSFSLMSGPAKSARALIRYWEEDTGCAHQVRPQHEQIWIRLRVGGVSRWAAFLSVRLCTNFMCSDTTMEDKDEINIKQLNLETTIIQTFRVRYQICTSNANSCFLCMTEQQVYSTIIVSKKVFHVSFSIVFCTVEKCTVNRDETNECLV